MTMKINYFQNVPTCDLVLIVHLISNIFDVIRVSNIWFYLTLLITHTSWFQVVW